MSTIISRNIIVKDKWIQKITSEKIITSGTVALDEYNLRLELEKYNLRHKLEK